MKHKTNNTKRTDSASGEAKRIHFEFIAPEAVSVAIAGTFNDWRPEASPMISLGDGRWAKDLALPPGNHEYCLVVDGQWKPDPDATDSVPNPFGGVNSVRKVGGGGTV